VVRVATPPSLGGDGGQSSGSEGVSGGAAVVRTGRHSRNGSANYPSFLKPMSATSVFNILGVPGTYCSPPCVVIDCRSFEEFAQLHIRGAINLPQSFLHDHKGTRRVSPTGESNFPAGRVEPNEPIEQYMRSASAAASAPPSVAERVYTAMWERFSMAYIGCYMPKTLILYTSEKCGAQGKEALVCTATLLRNSRRGVLHDIAILERGFKTFSKLFPFQCRSHVEMKVFPGPFLLYPTQILPYVYVGSEKNAQNRKQIEQLGISYIVNCEGDTKRKLSMCAYFDLRVDGEQEPKPNFCTECGTRFRIAVKFCSACGNRVSDKTAKRKKHIDFHKFVDIVDRCRRDAGRTETGRNILIHCKTGNNFSAAVTIAFLMYLHRDLFRSNLSQSNQHHYRASDYSVQRSLSPHHHIPPLISPPPLTSSPSNRERHSDQVSNGNISESGNSKNASRLSPGGSLGNTSVMSTPPRRPVDADRISADSPPLSNSSKRYRHARDGSSSHGGEKPWTLKRVLKFVRKHRPTVDIASDLLRDLSRYEASLIAEAKALVVDVLPAKRHSSSGAAANGAPPPAPTTIPPTPTPAPTPLRWPGWRPEPLKITNAMRQRGPPKPWLAYGNDDDDEEGVHEEIEVEVKSRPSNTTPILRKRHSRNKSSVSTRLLDRRNKTSRRRHSVCFASTTNIVQAPLSADSASSKEPNQQKVNQQKTIQQNELNAAQNKVKKIPVHGFESILGDDFKHTPNDFHGRKLSSDLPSNTVTIDRRGSPGQNYKKKSSNSKLPPSERKKTPSTFTRSMVPIVAGAVGAAEASLCRPSRSSSKKKKSSPAKGHKSVRSDSGSQMPSPNNGKDLINGGRKVGTVPRSKPVVRVNGSPNSTMQGKR